MSLTPPVSEREFRYANGDLYAEASGQNRHRRESVADLKNLFHPKGNTTGKDPPAHWYEAQLIHYGLPPSKIKGTAVKRLLDAVNSGNLSVPKHILDLEKSLKKQWDANDRKAKKEIKDAAVNGGTNKSQAKKRKADEPTSTTTAPSSVVPTKKSKTTTAATKPKSIDTGARTKKSANAVKAPSTKTSTTTSVTSPPRPKQTARRTGTPIGMLNKASTSINASTIRKNSTASSKPSTEGMAKKQMKKEPKIERSPENTMVAKKQIKKEPKRERSPKNTMMAKKQVKKESKRESSSEDTVMAESEVRTASLGLINGEYTISCPYIEGNWPDDVPEGGLTMTMCLDTPRIWGSFDFGTFEGVALIPQRPFRASTKQFPLYFRGRETGEGEIFYDEERYPGSIAFIGGGVIEGYVSLPFTGEQAFSGRRMPGPAHVGVSAGMLEDEWNDYNAEQYEEERVGRWR